MRKLCLALLCLAPALSWTQNEAYVLAKQLAGLSSLTLNFEHNEANLDESSLYSFYGAVNDLYGATEIQICYDEKTFEERRNDLGARRKQWLMDLIRQEQIELLSENMHPSLPSNATGQVALFYRPRPDNQRVVIIRDTTYFSEEVGWEFTHAQDMMTEVANMTKAEVPVDIDHPLTSSQTMTGGFLQVQSVFSVHHPDRFFWSKPVQIKSLSANGKVKAPLNLYLFNPVSNRWMKFGNGMVSQKKKGDHYFFNVELIHSGTYAIASELSFPKDYDACVYSNDCSVIQADLKDPRMLYNGQCIVQDNLRVIWIPKVKYPNDTYIEIQYRDKFGQVTKDEMSVAYLLKLQSPAFRFLIDLKNNLEEDKSLTQNQEP